MEEEQSCLDEGCGEQQFCGKLRDGQRPMGLIFEFNDLDNIGMQKIKGVFDHLPRARVAEGLLHRSVPSIASEAQTDAHEDDQIDPMSRGSRSLGGGRSHGFDIWIGLLGRLGGIWGRRRWARSSEGSSGSLEWMWWTLRRDSGKSPRRRVLRFRTGSRYPRWRLFWSSAAWNSSMHSTESG